MTAVNNKDRDHRRDPLETFVGSPPTTRHPPTSGLIEQLQVDRVAHGGERVIIERRGKVLGAVVSADDLALLERVRGGARKWALIEAAGPMEPAAGVMVQRAGLSLDDAAEAYALYDRRKALKIVLLP